MKKNHKPLFVLIACLIAGFAAAGALAQESGSASAGSGPPQVLQGKIRWKKALGTVPFTAGLSAPHSDPCLAFHILVVTATQEQTLLNYTDALTWKPEEGEFNVCNFKTSAPSDLPIRVYAAIGRKDASTEQQDYLYLRGGWAGGEKVRLDSGSYPWFLKGRNVYPGNLIDPTPETGYKRGFTRDRYDVTLGRKAMYLSFEMVYVSNRFGGYPKYTEPAPPPPKPPYITASQPVVIQPFLPFASTFIGWDGGPDHPKAEVFVSVSGEPELSASVRLQNQAFSFATISAIEVKLERGRQYRFVLKDAGNALSTVVVVAP
jgi:hypothetical protein